MYATPPPPSAPPSATATANHMAQSNPISNFDHFMSSSASDFSGVSSTTCPCNAGGFPKTRLISAPTFLVISMNRRRFLHLNIYIYISTFNISQDHFVGNPFPWKFHHFCQHSFRGQPNHAAGSVSILIPKRLNWRCLCFQLADQWSFSRLEQILVGNVRWRYWISTWGIEQFSCQKRVWKQKCQTPSTTIPKTANTNFIRLSCDSANGPNTKSCYPQATPGQWVLQTNLSFRTPIIFITTVVHCSHHIKQCQMFFMIMPTFIWKTVHAFSIINFPLRHWFLHQIIIHVMCLIRAVHGCNDWRVLMI